MIINSKLLPKPVILYEGQATSLATLSQSIKPFKKLLISTYSSNGFSSVITILKDSETDSITTGALSGNTSSLVYYGMNARISINDKTLTVDRIGEFAVKNNNTSVVTNNNNAILVNKVLGYYEY